MSTLESNIDYYRKIALKQPTGLPCGIYFNLPAERYHNDPAISRGGIAYLLQHYYLYWVNSPLNKNKKSLQKRQTEEMRLGEMRHEYIFEPAKFAAKYRSAYSKYDASKETVPHELWEKLEKSAEALGDGRELYFTDGYPEVTIVWLDPLTNLKFRARIDYLRTFGGMDYKTIHEITNVVIGQHVAKYCYDLQSGFYTPGLEVIKAGLRAGTVKAYGDHDPAWLKRFADDKTTGFGFCFQRSEPPFIFRFHFLPQDVLMNAEKQIRDGAQVYLDALAKFGAEKEWELGSLEMTEFPMRHIPQSIYYRGG